MACSALPCIDVSTIWSYLVLLTLFFGVVLAEGCEDGYYGRECHSHCRCKHGIACHRETGDCICKKGYTGLACDTDINECIIDSSLCQERNTFCINTRGSYECSCPVGYQQSNVSGTCLPCPLDSFGFNCSETCNCDKEHTVICDQPTGLCICEPGWEGEKCTLSVEDCINDPCPGQICVDKHQTFICRCNHSQRLFNGECQHYRVDLFSFNRNPAVGEYITIYILFALPKMYLNHVSSGPNFRYELQDNSTSESGCLFDFQSRHFKLYGNETFLKGLNRSITYHFYSDFKRSFHKSGNIELKGVSSDDIDSINLSFNVQFKSLTAKGCLDNMTIDGVSDSISRPKEIRRQSYTKFTLMLSDDKSCHEIPRVEWEFYKVSDESQNEKQHRQCIRSSDYELLNIVKLDNDSGNPIRSDHREVTEIIAKNTLPIGMVMICVKAYVQQNNDFYAVHCGFVKIVLSYEIRGQMDPNSLDFSWYRGVAINIKANYHELDQDMPLTFKWSCRVKKKENAKPKACPFDLTTGNNLNISGNKLSNKDYVYRISVDVAIKENPHKNAAPSRGEIKFKLSSYKYYVIMKCIEGCKGGKVGLWETVKIRFFLHKVKEREKKVTKFTWVVWKGKIRMNQQEIDRIGSSTNHQYYWKEESTFETQVGGLEPNTDYTFVCTVTFEIWNIKRLYYDDYEEHASYLMRTGNLPTGDGCSISPAVGNAVFTKFTVECFNYTDETRLPLKYRLHQLVSIEDNPQPFYTVISDSNSHVVKDITLSDGNHTDITNIVLRVDIVNVRRDKTVVHLVVNLATEDQMKVLDEFDLDNITDNGDQKDLRAIKDISTTINANSSIDVKAPDAKVRKTSVRQKMLGKLGNVKTSHPGSIELMSFVLDKTVEVEGEIENSGIDQGLKAAESLTKNLGKVDPENAELTKQVASSQVNAVGRMLSVNSDFGRHIAKDGDHGQQNGCLECTKEQIKANSLKAVFCISQIQHTLGNYLKKENEPIRLSTRHVDLEVELKTVNEESEYNLCTRDRKIQFILPTMDVGATENEKVESRFESYNKDPYAWSSNDVHGGMAVASVNIVRLADKHNVKKSKKEWRFSKPAHIWFDYDDTKADPITITYNVSLDINTETRDIVKSTCIFFIISASKEEATILKISSAHNLQLKVKAQYTSQTTYFNDLSDEEMMDFPYTEAEYMNHTSTDHGFVKRDNNLLFLPQLRNIQLKQNAHYRLKIVVNTFQSQGINISSLTKATARTKLSLSKGNSSVDANNMTELYNSTVLVTPYKVKCVHYDNDAEKYVSNHCGLTKFSNLERVHCRCLVAGTFSASVLPMPDLINPLDIEPFLDIMENSVVVTTVLLIWIFFFVGIVWARRKDKIDEGRRGVTVLEDNSPSDRYVYLICVETGTFLYASTSSNVYMYLKGSHGKSSHHHLKDDSRYLFMRGDRNWFILTTEENLGDLVSCVVWIDYSGNHPGWYLSSVYVENMQTDESWLFKYHDWISTVFGSMRLIVEVPSVKSTNVSDHWTSRLISKSITEIRNNHLWIGLFAKSPFNMFSRVNRIVTGLSIIQTLMLLNMIFFQDIDTDDATQSVTYLGVTFHVRAMIVSSIVAIILVLVTYLIQNLLVGVAPRPMTQKEPIQPEKGASGKASNTIVSTESKRRWISICFLRKRSSKIEDIEKGRTEEPRTKDSNENRKQGSTHHSTSSHTRSSGSTIRSCELISEKSLKDEGESLKKKEERRLKEKQAFLPLLPWWCKFISWPLIIFMNLFMGYYIMLYGLSLGEEKSLEWLNNFFFGFFFNAAVVQPARLLVLSFALVLLFNAGHTFGDMKPVDELSDGETLLELEKKRNREMSILREKRSAMRFHEPLTKINAQSILKRLKMAYETRAILREFMMYVLFLSMVLVMADGHMDVYNRYMQTAHTREKLVGQESFAGGDEYSEFLHEIHKVEDIWKYLQVHLVPNLLQEKSELTETYDTWLVGPPRLRQVRLTPDTTNCDPFAWRFKRLIDSFGEERCTYPMSGGQVETRSFLKTWSNESNIPVKDMEDSPYVYRSAEDIQSSPYEGVHETYPGGGFIAILPRYSEQTAMKAITDLNASDWVDQYTRCLFVELTTYNPNSHLFTHVILTFEIENYGVIYPRKSFFTSQLFHYSVKKEWLQYTELFVVLCVILYTIFEINKIRTVGMRGYFTNVWNPMELCLLVSCYLTGLLFLLRFFTTQDVVDSFRRYGHSRFIDFTAAFYRDEELQISLGFMSALAIYKMMKLFTFNPFTKIFTKTFEVAGFDILNYIAYVVIYLVALATMGMLSFGKVYFGYHTLLRSMLRLVFFSLGEAYFDHLVLANNFMGHVFFLVAMVITQYIIINFFVSIIKEAFMVARFVGHKEERRKSFKYLMEEVKRWFGFGFKNIRKD